MRNGNAVALLLGSLLLGLGALARDVAAGVIVDPLRLGSDGDALAATPIWKLDDVQTQGADVVSDLLSAGVDASVDAGFDTRTDVHLDSATVMPEPGTAGLLGLGLVGLALAGGRRSR